MQAGDPMYNRYIPQADGSYRRHSVSEPEPPIMEMPIPDAVEPDAPQIHVPHPAAGRIRRQNGDSFLQRLLPKDFDSGDLLVAALLLLTAGDDPESRNNALLTLAMYFMM